MIEGKMGPNTRDLGLTGGLRFDIHNPCNTDPIPKHSNFRTPSGVQVPWSAEIVS